MMIFDVRGTAFLLRTYVVATFTIAAVFAPTTLSLVSILLLLLFYLYLWRWPVSAVITLLRDYFVYFAIAILLLPIVGHPVVLLIIALPVLVLINYDLEKTAWSLTYRETEYARRPTNIYLSLSVIAILALTVALLLGSSSLLLASAVIISYLGILGIVVLRHLPLKPIAETQAQLRMVSGTRDQFDVRLTIKTGIGGLLFLESPYEWLKVNPNILSLKATSSVIKVSLSPILSGPSIIKLKGQATDRWGLIRVNFELKPINLYVVPRARYAAWLVKKYLTNTKMGDLLLVSSMAAFKPTYGLRSGIEYYGSQLYQPGDSLKNIDWKHSMKYNELVSKEFADFYGQPAIVLINLAVDNAEEADKLAYNIVVTAISLARENVPAALAVYDHKDVKVTTRVLQPQQLVLQSFQVAREMITFINPVKYLNPPDIGRLRANLSRIRFAESKAAKVLNQLLQLEYNSLSNAAKLHPATKALRETFTKVDKKSSIIVISYRNHDAEALAFNTFSFNRKGNAVINV